MELVNILGTGNAMVTKCYNTCFTISNGKNHLLVDTGGGNTILSNLEKLNIGISGIHHVFISHRHNDHISGITWGSVRKNDNGYASKTHTHKVTI